MSERINKIKKIFSENDIPSFRLKQLIKAIYDDKTSKYSEIKTLPLNIRKLITEELGDEILTLKKIKETSDTQVQKVLFETYDHQQIESVRMLYLPNGERDHFHTSLCISSQSGCALGCKFCATGAMGFKKNLQVDEIIDQLLYFRKNNISIKNISFMGMGEPFLNPNFWEVLKDLTDPDQIGMSQQRINISTVGIVEGINKLGTEFNHINLAFSLHSPFEAQRIELMPISQKYSIKDVFEALNAYITHTNRKVFIAYALMDDVNDSIKHANALASLIKAQGSKWYLYHVNLIRYNPWGDIVTFRAPNNNRVNVFLHTLENLGIQVTLRKTFGDKIDAACGQLASRTNKK